MMAAYLAAMMVARWDMMMAAYLDLAMEVL